MMKIARPFRLTDLSKIPHLIGQIFLVSLGLSPKLTKGNPHEKVFGVGFETLRQRRQKIPSSVSVDIQCKLLMIVRNHFRAVIFNILQKQY